MVDYLVFENPYRRTLALDHQIRREVVPLVELGPQEVAYFKEACFLVGSTQEVVDPLPLVGQRTLVVLYQEVGRLAELSSLVKQSLEVVDCFALELKALVVASACLDFEELTTLVLDVGWVVVSSPMKDELSVVVLNAFKLEALEVVAMVSIGFGQG